MKYPSRKLAERARELYANGLNRGLLEAINEKERWTPGRYGVTCHPLAIDIGRLKTNNDRPPALFCL
jgi:hypothetical protein